MRARAALVGGVALAGAVAAVAVVASPDRAAPADPSARPWTSATVASTPPDLQDDPEAVALVRRAAVAAATGPYVGTTTVVEADDEVQRRLEVVHVPGQGTLVRSGGTEAVDPDEPGSGSLSEATQYLDLLTRNHALRTDGEAVVAGRAALAVVALRASGTIAARFWFDQATGLLLRREVFDASGAPAGWAAFEALEAPVPASDVSWTMPSQASPTPVGQAALGRLRDEGWLCPEALPAGMALVGAHEADDGAVHLVYSDGVTAMSLFEQRGRLATDAMTGYEREDVDGAVIFRRAGSPPQWVWQSQGGVFTLVADVPTPAVARVLAALPPDGSTDDQGLRDRLGTGLGELARRVGEVVSRSGS